MFSLQFAGDGVVVLAGRLDAAEAENAMEALKALDRPTTLECSGLDYISSAGIGVIIETYKRLKAAGHGLRLVGLTPRVRNVFTYAGLDRLLTIE